MQHHHPNGQTIALTLDRGKPTIINKTIQTNHHIVKAEDRRVVEDDNEVHRVTRINLEQEALEALGIVDIIILPQVDIDNNHDDTPPLTLVSDPFWFEFNEWRQQHV